MVGGGSNGRGRRGQAWGKAGGLLMMLVMLKVLLEAEMRTHNVYEALAAIARTAQHNKRRHLLLAGRAGML